MTWIAAGSAAIIVLLVAMLLSPLRVNHDCAMYLQEAELLLDGGVPYVDFVETNPPLIVYLSALPVMLARTTGISAIVCFHGLVVLLLIVSAAELYCLMTRPWRPFLPHERGVLLFVWLALALAVLRRHEFGQREHLFVLLYVPYLFLRIGRYQGGSAPWPLAVLLGLQAGVGAAIKPHFLMTALLVEIVLLCTTRLPRGSGSADGNTAVRKSGSLQWADTSLRCIVFRPENVALVLIVLAYLAHWLFVPAAMREAFFYRWLPMIREGYAAYDSSYRQIAEEIFRRPLLVFLLAATVLAAAGAIGGRSRLRDYLLALAAFTASSLAMVFVQKKGWSYHAIPLEAGAAVATSLAAIQILRRLHRSRRWRFMRVRLIRAGFAAGWLLLASVLALILSGRFPPEGEPPVFASLRRIVETHSRPGEAVMLVASSVRPAYPMLLQLDRKPGSRYLCCFPIAFFNHGGDLEAAQRRFLDELAEDIGHRTPRLVIIADFPGGQGLPRSFNCFDYLSESGWIGGSLHAYGEISGPDGWRVFVRDSNYGRPASNLSVSCRRRLQSPTAMPKTTSIGNWSRLLQ